jgi:EAL domain-containing protein (putative c-di-GMP-specific phosphodiesterase class I)
MNFLYQELVVLVLIITLIELIFFLAFQRQRMGINKLTKLNDSGAFYTEVNKRVKQRQSFKTYLIKIRNLSVIKQHYGHKVGDELLYQFAFSLERLFSDGLCYHLNGTVFAVVLPDGSTNTTAKLREFLDKGITYIDEQQYFDYILVEYSGRYESNAEAFYEKLEYAAEVAKESNQKYIRCSTELEATLNRKKYIISRMKNISVEEGYEIWFQPIYNTKSNTCTSVEVLLRLKEKNGQFISPAEFIPIAEKTGQITAISWFVIEQTCKALSENKQLKGIKASINLPMMHLIDPSFENKLNDIVDGYRVDHERIGFEFTERVILENLDIAEKNMRRLTRSGYSFYLDDFGTGYSNFNCVLRLPFKTVKLDSSLISAQERLHTINNPVNMLTDLFHDIGLFVIVEGIETKEMLDQMVSFEVDGIQGYYYAKPMPVSKLTNFLESQK